MNDATETEPAFVEIEKLLNAAKEIDDPEKKADLQNEIRKFCDILKERFARELLTVLLHTSTPCKKESVMSPIALAMSERFYDARISKKMTITQLAKKAQIGVNTICMAESRSLDAKLKPLFFVLKSSTRRVRNRINESMLRVAKLLDIPAEEWTGFYNEVIKKDDE